MNHNDYVAHDALGLARLIAAGAASADEVLVAARARLDRVNPALNAVTHRMDAIADERAGQAVDGPFAGVPFLLKDLFQDYAGVPSAAGNRALKRAAIAADTHAEITRRFIQSGVNIFGKTNTPEFGAKGITEPEAFGVTRNPWHHDHTAGGSSGGAAAAVAAGVVPMAGGNDSGGSLRIPAACCGVFALKPGRARAPGGPKRSDIMHGASVDHVITRSVRDSAAMLDVTAGYEHGAIAQLEPPATSYLAAINTPPKPLRVGIMAHSPLSPSLHHEAHAALNHTGTLLESLGHQVEYAQPRIDDVQLAQDFLSMLFTQMALSVDEVRAQTRTRTRDFELDTRTMAHVGRAFTAIEYMTMYNHWQGYRHALADFHTDYDLLLTPTLAGPPPRIGETATPAWQRWALSVLLRLPSGRALIRSGIMGTMAHAQLKYVPFTQLANLTGVPAMSVPLHVTAGGLPLGSQFVGPPGGETLLLQLAAQLEQAQPWFDRLPEMNIAS